MYNIIRKHSEDKNTSIIETVKTKRKAQVYIRKAINELKTTTSFNYEVKSMDDVTNINFSSSHSSIKFSIGFWFEKI